MTLIIVAVIAIFIVINALAYRQVRRLLNFIPGAAKPVKPDELSSLQKFAIALFGVALPRPENDRNPADLGLQFETVVFKAADGTKLEGWLIPREEARGLVVFFHGYSVAKAHMLDEAKDIFDAGYSCLMIDFRGSGGSSGNTTTVGYYEAHDVTAAYYKALTSGAKGPIILYGQSMGGAAILRAIDDLQMKPDAIILESVFDRLLTAVEQRFHAFSLPSFGLAKLTVMWGSLQNGFNGFKHNPVDYAVSVRCPTLVINGDLDRRVTLDQAREIYGTLPIRHKRFVSLEGAGHNSPRSDNPGQWRKAVTEFLNSLVAA